jgi:hypothetical protein
MSKNYKIKTTGYGSDVFVYPVDEEQLETLRDSDVESAEMDIDEVCGVLGIDDYFSSDYVYNGINVTGDLTENITITVYDENDNIIWESDKSFEFDYNNVEEQIVHDDEDCLMVQEAQKGTFMVYDIELEDDEEFNPKLLSPTLTEICDGVLQLITGLSYDDKEMNLDFGDTNSKGTYFYLYEYN